MVRTPRVFISYSHDSEQHRERVLALSERLRLDGIERAAWLGAAGTRARPHIYGRRLPELQDAEAWPLDEGGQAA